MTDPLPVRRCLRDLAARRLGLAIPADRDRCLDRAAAVLGFDGAGADAATLAALDATPWEAEAWQRMVRQLTVGETSFLRHREWFAAIEERVLAPLIQERRRSGRRQLRVWSAACSTGEEPYSLAMIIDRLIPDRDGWDVTIVGSDINAASLAAARAACFGAWSLRELTAAERTRCFNETAPGRFRLRRAYRTMVTFRCKNLVADDYPDRSGEFAGFDLILCRNVLIYLTREAQQTVAQRLIRCLAPDGWLAVSAAEATAERFRPLVPVRLPSAILFRHATSAVPGDKAPSPRRPASPTFGSPEGTPCWWKPPPAVCRPAPVQPAPTTGNGGMAEARALADRGMLDAARHACESILARDALDGEANLLLASVCAEVGEWAPALEAARRAAYLMPRSPAAHFQLGMAHRCLGRTAAARRSLEAVVALLTTAPDGEAVPQLADTTAGSLRQTAHRCLESMAASSGGYHGRPD